jgi:hypothetical protein
VLAAGAASGAASGHSAGEVDSRQF